MQRTGRARSAALCSIAFFAGALFASAYAHADDLAPHEWLRRMGKSLRDADFQGSFIYQHDGRIDALRIFHQGAPRERERLISLTGERSEVIRDDREVICILPGTPPTRFANRADLRLLPLVPDLDNLGAQYGVTLGGADRVAGYDARIVDIVPRDPFRYGYRLWLQRDNQLVLRSAVLDVARHPIAEFMFVALDIGAKPSETDLAPAVDVGGAVAAGDTESPAGTTPHWLVSSAPPGFRLVRTQRPSGESSDIEHLVYTDGIASVSVYIEPIGPNTKPSEATTTQRGLLSVHSEDANGLRVTALGDVPPATVQAMVRGVSAAAPR
jgi:sigma-E factor negative regulatory protein RseB